MHLLRTLRPDLSASYARGHDDAVWRCLLALLGEKDDARQRRRGHRVGRAHTARGPKHPLVRSLRPDGWRGAGL